MLRRAADQGLASVIYSVAARREPEQIIVLAERDEQGGENESRKRVSIPTLLGAT